MLSTKYLYVNCLPTRHLDDYLAAVNGMQDKLIRKSGPNQLTFVGELISGNKFSPKMVCEKQHREIDINHCILTKEDVTKVNSTPFERFGE